MKLLLLILLLYGNFAIAKSDEFSHDCSSCHLSDRENVNGHFPTGFGRWRNDQCYGCHNEIDEIATNHINGKEDSRFSSLPISDKRLQVMSSRPLPYLNTSEIPWKELELDKTSNSSLVNFLRRPHGKCYRNSGCKAPNMMAFPKASIKNLGGIMKAEPPHVPTGDKINGQKVFNGKCVKCHEYSDASGYNSVALSLFNANWLQLYANGTNQISRDRKMPIIDLSQKEALDLESFFFSKRQSKEREVDALVNKGLSNLKNMNKGVTDSIIDYIWTDFWRDGDCVHCHSIGGRATKAFDTSLSGIAQWLNTNDPMEIVHRLVIRHAEDTLGLGANKPGMPMTGEPVSFTAISMLHSWIDNGCPDLSKKYFCKKGH